MMKRMCSLLSRALEKLQNWCDTLAVLCSVNGCRGIACSLSVKQISLCALRYGNSWVLLKSKLSSSYLCEKWVFLVGCPAVTQWIIENGIGKDHRKPSRPREKIPSLGWLSRPWPLARYKAHSVRSGSQGCFVTFGTVRQKVTCQMERACRPLLGLSCCRVLVKESDSLQLVICQYVLARILLTYR